jgi:signal transduction histidine kinase
MRRRLPSHPDTVLAPLTAAARKRKTVAVDPRPLLFGDDDERRSIERSLHDSVQQRLVALAVELQLARSAVADDPDEAVRLIDDARANLGEALDEIRAVAQRIHPALLDSQGLVAALRMAADAARVPVEVETSVDGVVPPEAAVTAYRLCVAALACADGRVVVTARGRDGALELEIAGSGVGAAPLDALRSRVGLLGGTLEIAPARIAAALPLTPARLPPPDT